MISRRFWRISGAVASYRLQIKPSAAKEIETLPKRTGNALWLGFRDLRPPPGPLAAKSSLAVNNIVCAKAITGFSILWTTPTCWSW